MSTLEKVRETIRREVAKADPVEGARRALELIVETSVRIGNDDGREVITVLDDDGKPRVGKGGAAEFTIQDLLAELRGTHPTLFAAGPARPTVADKESAKEEPQGSPPPSVPQPRDWLILDQAHGAARVKESLTRGVTSLTHDLDAAATALGRKLADAGESVRATAGEVRDLVRVTLHNPDDPGEPAASESLRAPRFVDRLSGRLPVAAAAAVVLLLAGGTVLYQLVLSPSGVEPAQQTAAATAPPRAEPAATGSVPPPAADPSSAPAPASSAALRGVPEVIDTATLSMQGKVVSLFGVQWSRGAGEPTDLAGYLRGREVSCLPAAEDAKSYRCQVEGQDLSRVVLFNGGGRTTSTATPDLLAAEAQARSAKSGLWSKTP